MNNPTTGRMTMAQAIVAFLKNQYVERDGVEQPFFAGCFGIFGHGNIAGMGQALQQMPEFRYYQARNEQAMVHIATAFTKTRNRLQTFACTSSIGPGATNMVTGAATATINRLPVLLLPGDIFARRNVAPVLQQLESEHTQDISVNDCFKPVSRYWDRIARPEQLLTSLPEAMRVLTSPSETGTVTLALPQDVQTEAYAYPAGFFHKRVWHISRNRPDRLALEQAAAWIRASQRPLIVAGGGVIYSEATDTLRQFVFQTGIPVGETMAGKGSLPYDYPLNLGAIGATGTFAANRIARDADLVIGIGTRYSDFTTASKTAFQHPEVRFININVAEFDASKHQALPLVGDARATLEELLTLLNGHSASGLYHVDESYRAHSEQLHSDWDAEVERIYTIRNEPLPSQGELIGAVNEHSASDSIMVCAAGSLPGDLHNPVPVGLFWIGGPHGIVVGIVRGVFFLPRLLKSLADVKGDRRTARSVGRDGRQKRFIVEGKGGSHKKPDLLRGKQSRSRRDAPATAGADVASLRRRLLAFPDGKAARRLSHSLSVMLAVYTTDER